MDLSEILVGEFLNSTGTRLYSVHFNTACSERALSVSEFKVCNGNVIDGIGAEYSVATFLEHPHAMRFLARAHCEWLLPILQQNTSSHRDLSEAVRVAIAAHVTAT